MRTRTVSMLRLVQTLRQKFILRAESDDPSASVPFCFLSELGKTIDVNADSVKVEAWTNDASKFYSSHSWATQSIRRFNQVFAGSCLMAARDGGAVTAAQRRLQRRLRSH